MQQLSDVVCPVPLSCRYAIRPRDVCNRTGTGSSKGIVIKSKNNYWESVWGRPLKGRGGGGHTIYMHADSYNSMVRPAKRNQKA